jgi:hypothetical protein
MLEFRMNVTVEVDKSDEAIAIKIPVDIQLLYQGGRWRAQCESPPVSTLVFDSMEEALVAGVKDLTREMKCQRAFSD